MAQDNNKNLEDDKGVVEPLLYGDMDMVVDVGHETPIDINGSDLFASEELVLELDFASVASFKDLSLYLEGIEDKFGVDFPDFSSGTRENIIVSNDDSSQVMVFDSDTPTTAIITGGNEINAGTVSGDVALFITEGNIKLDLIGGTTTAFVENLSESDINLTGSQGDIVLSVLSDNYQEGEYSFKGGQLFRGDEKLSVFFEDIDNFKGNFIINDVQSNSVQVLLEGDKQAFDGMEEGLRDFFIISDEEDDIFVDNNLDAISDNTGIILEIDETFKNLDLSELGGEIFAEDEITIDASSLEAVLNAENATGKQINSFGSSDANALSATEELLSEYEDASNKTNDAIEVSVKLEEQTEEIFDDFVANDLVAAFINDDAIDIILDD